MLSQNVVNVAVDNNASGMQTKSSALCRPCLHKALPPHSLHVDFCTPCLHAYKRRRALPPHSVLPCCFYLLDHDHKSQRLHKLYIFFFFCDHAHNGNMLFSYIYIFFAEDFQTGFVCYLLLATHSNDYKVYVHINGN